MSRAWSASDVIPSRTGDAAYAEDNSFPAQRRALQEVKDGSEYAIFASGRQVFGAWDDHGRRISLLVDGPVLV